MRERFDAVHHARAWPGKIGVGVHGEIAVVAERK
jgi:hypothetical protein